MQKHLQTSTHVKMNVNTSIFLMTSKMCKTTTTKQTDTQIADKKSANK